MSLDQATAEARSLLIRTDSITYNYNIILQEDKYYGLAELNFYINSLNFNELKIDFAGTIIELMIVNSAKYPPPETQTNFVTIPKKYLQKGRNKISIMYINGYNEDRKGCIKFEDEQENTYVYTDFEPYGANRVFPCFDQPNLKAKMKLSIVTPPEWIALSNQPPISTGKFDAQLFKKHTNFLQRQSNDLLDIFLSNASNQTVMTQFDYTEQLPSYIFSFAAGPYTRIDSDPGTGTVPMSLYCAASSTYNVERYSQFIFDVTQKTMAFFEKFFGTRFPFQKYDQIFIREYDAWAMENAGLVTFDQQKALVANPTENNYYDLADVITHELSHHWFGNYVTMTWWDDLWLNQSFADFISQFALSQVNDTLNHPLQPSTIYFRDRKQWGYDEDQRTTATHAIRGTVSDTNVAESIFDGITYAKGAAVLKQLMFLVGQNQFSTGLKSYFGRFAWSNATINDFLADFSPYFPERVTSDDWRKSWLETPSLNFFESMWDPLQQTNTATISLVQTPFDDTYNTLRYHNMQVAFFDNNGTIVDIKSVLVTPDTEQVDFSYDGTKNVTAVLVNYNDQTFMENVIDPVSLQFFKQNISKITDKVARALIWYNISQMNKHQLMRVDDYVAFIEVQLFNEQMNFILERMLDQLLNFLDHFVSQDVKISLKTTIFNKIYTSLQSPSLLDDDRIMILEENYVKYAETDEQVMQICQWLKREDPALAKHNLIDDQLSWQIVKKVFGVSDATMSQEMKWDVFAYNRMTDNSYRADDAKIVCETILSSPDQLNTIYQALRSPSGYDMTTRYLLSQGFMNKYNEEQLITTFRDKYFDDLINPLVYGQLSYNLFQLFYDRLKPIESDYSVQVTRYQYVLSKLVQVPQMAAHCVNISKIIDDLNQRIRNNTFNNDSNLTLTQYRAAQRFSYIDNNTISYISHIDYLDPTDSTGLTNYAGLTEITFYLNNKPKLLPIDFISSNITDIVVNGYNVGSVSNGEFLLIPKVYLNIGYNNIAVNYVSTFNNDGEGCMMYNDQNHYYTYTHFEPWSAHRFIPCFDQPDLKANASFNVILPINWIAVANTNYSYTGPYNEADYIAKVPSQNQDLLVGKYLVNKTGNFYVFDKTQLLPTYLFCLAAGQYFSISLDATQRYNDIPMTLYSLTSYSNALQQNSDFIFEITKLSVQFFQQKFGVPYQFPKYDTIFCHEFKAGAMENPGLITFNDTYLYQQIVSIEKMVALGVVISHQCAHNWFGDYVTMKWWNDLWLNQAFADFMSYYCIDSIKDKVTTLPSSYTSGWLGGLARAVGGYREDQMSTTHPVRSQIPNTSLATVYFDSITYRKGSMTLKQLMFLMGEANFLSGIKDYFNDHGWKNATIKEFLDSMEPYFTITQFSLEEWQDMWLLTPSLNIITVIWDQKSRSTNAILTINQANYTNEYDMLRFHNVNIAFFKSDGSYTTKTVLIQNDSQTTVTYDASPGIVAILVNQGHQAFIKYRFDKISQQWFINNINLITDPLTRMIIYFYMNEEVRDGLNRVMEYTDDILLVINNEPEDTVYDFEIKFLNESTGSYIPSGVRGGVRMNIFDFVMSQLQAMTNPIEKYSKFRCIKNQFIQQERKSQGKPKNRINSRNIKSPNATNRLKMVKTLSDQQNRITLLKDYLPMFCSTEDQIKNLQDWREGINPDLLKYPITPSQAWSVVILVYGSPSFDQNQRQIIYDDQETKDPGIAASLALQTCVALTADDGLMEVIYEGFKENDQSVTVKTYLAAGWNSFAHQNLLYNIYKQKFFTDLPLMSTKLLSNHFQFFYSNLKPIDDDLQVTIDSFSEINLPGSDMIGHMNNIRKIIDTYKLRLNLYIANSMFEKK